MSSRRVRAEDGHKLQIFIPEKVALLRESRTGQLELSDPSETLLWAALHPNPLIGITVVAHDVKAATSRYPDPTHDPKSAEPQAEMCGSHHQPLPPPNSTRAVAGDAPTKRDKRDPEQWPFYCDACQKGFATKETYETHQDSHMYCTVPGCHFTCRKDKAYRMDEHMELLHNRPDAPDFADMSVYLDQRRARFPTHETVQTKVAEIYYKAARGAVLPDERRRWMRQHGIQIGKRPRSGQAYIARGHLDEELQQPELETELEKAHTASSHDGANGEKEAKARQPHVDTDHSSEPNPVGEAPTAPAKRPRVVPLGPNGTLTPLQRVQLVRQRYADATEVTSFYVCHRCGKKGDHWLSDCPTHGDPTYDRAVKREESARSHASASPGDEQTRTPTTAQGEAPHPRTTTDTPRSQDGENGGQAEATRAEATSDVSDEDEMAPPVHSARPTNSAEASCEKERTRLIAPVAAARLAAKSTGSARRTAASHAPAQGNSRAREPGLYDRLTEEDRLNEMGLLLQAFRFFVSRDFFEPRPSA